MFQLWSFVVCTFIIDVHCGRPFVCACVAKVTSAQVLFVWFFSSFNNFTSLSLLCSVTVTVHRRCTKSNDYITCVIIININFKIC
jgi:hypothetical protein